MFLKAVCLFTVLVAVSMEPQEMDTNGSVRLMFFPPNTDDERMKYSQRLRCRFDRANAGWKQVTKLRIVQTGVGDNKKAFKLLAAVNSKALIIGPDPSTFTATGKLYRKGNELSEVIVTYRPGQDYAACKTFKCVATGRDANDNKVSLYGEVGYFGAGGPAAC